MIQNLAIAGLGLLGGSIALAARERGLARQIVAVGRRDYPDAVEAGLIDSYTQDLAGAASEADLLVLCTPVEKILEQIPVAMEAAKQGGIVTDVGSTKRRLVEAAERVTSRGTFVGSHPMVGSHLTGWRHAEVDFFQRGITYVTATEKTDLCAAASLGAFWEALGARTVYVHPRRHDHLCAMLSHVPHMAAVSLIQLLAESREDPALLRVLSGTGLRDTTRIAKGSADVWSEICHHNAAEVADQLSDLSRVIQEFSELIREGDGDLWERLQQTAELRRKID